MRAKRTTIGAFNSVLAAIVLGVGFGSAVVAQEHAAEVTSSPGQVKGERLTTVTATVEAVDMKNRVVTLKGPKGNVFDVEAGPEVKNLPQVEVGDKVVVNYYQALTLQLKKGAAGVRGKTEEFALFTAEPGAKPAGTGAQQVTVNADVTNVDTENQTVTLRGPNRTVQLPVEDPEVLAKLKVGDQVQATYTEALAISVKPAPKQ
jgi:Cu/Ag efflux protein CusF